MFLHKCICISLSLSLFACVCVCICVYVCVCVCVCWKLQRAIEIAMSIQLYAYDPIKKTRSKIYTEWSTVNVWMEREKKKAHIEAIHVLSACLFACCLPVRLCLCLVRLFACLLARLSACVLAKHTRIVEFSFMLTIKQSKPLVSSYQKIFVRVRVFHFSTEESYIVCVRACVRMYTFYCCTYFSHIK